MKTLFFTSAFALLLAAGVPPQAQAGDRGTPQATVLDVNSHGNAMMQQRMTKKQMMMKKQMMKKQKMMRKKKMMNNM